MTATADQATGITAETRAVVEAVIEALAIPYAATVGGHETRTVILAERIRHLMVCMRVLADHDAVDVQWNLAYLRDRLAEHPPVGYVVRDEARERVQQGMSRSEAVTSPSRSPRTRASERNSGEHRDGLAAR